MLIPGAPSRHPLWDSLIDASPAVAAHARVYRRDIRGEPWVIVHNELSGTQVRVNAVAFDLVECLDGHRTLAEVFAEELPDADDAFREAFAHTLVTLESNGLVRLDRASDSQRLVARAMAQSQGRSLDPLSLRLPLLDPDRLVGKLLAFCQPFFGLSLTVLLLVVYAGGIVTALVGWPGIERELSTLARTPSAWWLYLLVFPLLKIAHELAHALLVKHHGGEVHEAGLTLLVLMPIPYVDASDSTRFERRSQRMAVTAAGMLAECAFASAGLVVWSLTEPGLIHDVAFAFALLGSVSTVLFNANPLLRFDGYHLLQDALDIPNLGTRSSAYLGWLVRRYLLRAHVGHSPLTGAHERRWLISYGLASLAYRWALTIVIALWLVTTIPLAGAALAVFALYRMLVRPLLRALHYLRRSPELEQGRLRASVGSALLAVSLLAFVGWMPMPSSTRAEGVVRGSAQAILHAPVAGEIVDVPIASGEHVGPGVTLVQLAAPELHARHAVLLAELEVLAALRYAALGTDPVEAAAVAVDMARVSAERDDAARDIASLSVAAPSTGRFAPTGGRLLRGERVERGEVLGHVVGDEAVHVEAVIEQQAIGRVLEGVQLAYVRLAEQVGTVQEARIVAAAPSGDRQLPSTALAHDGSRGIAVASEEGELRTLAPVFHVELQIPARASANKIGGRAYVTLVHDPESLGRRWWRATRQLFLEKLSV